MTNNTRHQGFTLVELSLVMAFISLLLLAILYSTIHIGKIYAKGVTNRQINQVGRELTDTIRRDFLTADAARIQSGIPSPTNSGSGRICLGNVSYVWNTAALLASNGDTIKGAAADSPAVVFSRVIDKGGSLCVKDGSGNYQVTALAGLSETELLSSEGRSLAVYSLAFKPLVAKGGDGLYNLDITVGTNDPSTVDSTTEQCKPPADNSSNFEYCSVAEFNITVRAGGDNK